VEAVELLVAFPADAHVTIKRQAYVSIFFQKVNILVIDLKLNMICRYE
jgi:hypothetical protein